MFTGVQRGFLFDNRSKNFHTSSSLLEPKDYYKILGVPKNASQNEIKKAYFNVSMIVFDLFLQSSLGLQASFN